jgi:hypothetical protein
MYRLRKGENADATCLLYTAGMFPSSLLQRHLEDDEIAVHIVRAHWIFALKALALPTLSVLLALAAFTVAKTNAALAVVAFWSAASLLWWVRQFLDYSMDAWIISNHGIIDLEWHGFFHRQSARVLFSDVQGVSYEIKGVLGTLLRYGTISIEKISTGGTVSIAKVYNPRGVEVMVLKGMETYMHTKNLKDAKHVQTILSEMVSDHVQMQEMEKLCAKQETTTPARKGFHTSKIGSKKP